MFSNVVVKSVSGCDVYCVPAPWWWSRWTETCRSNHEICELYIL